MCICTFFGHRDCPSSIREKLKENIIFLIEHHSVNKFYVGNNGAFDRLAKGVLIEIKKTYPQISFYVVLAYHPTNKDEEDMQNTILPFGVENVPKKLAILYRNEWMLKKAQYAICYVARPFGGAAKFYSKAKNKHKTVINLF